MEKRERVLDNSIELFGVIFQLNRVIYLYRGFITGLAKIATTVTLVDKIIRKLNLKPVHQILWIK